MQIRVREGPNVTAAGAFIARPYRSGAKQSLREPEREALLPHAPRSVQKKA